LAVQVRYYTDPACPWSWALEPAVRRLMVEFGEDLSWTYVMGGLARDYGKGDGGHGGAQGVYPGLVSHWLDVADQSGMPIDPRLWTEGPISSSYPGCMAVKAATEQGDPAAYLRALREGLFCFRRKLDGVEPLVEEARRVGLNVERFRIDVGSNAIVEAFGGDLEEFRAVGVALPAFVFGSGPPLSGTLDYGSLEEAAREAGASPVGARLSVLDALRRFGRLATREVVEVCGLRGPRAPAELWRLAEEWQVRPVRVLTGHLWELA
jgi:predicted DsbA family dithiol-disulfide isomerase